MWIQFVRPEKPSLVRRALPYCGVLVILVLIIWGAWSICLLQGRCTSFGDFYNQFMFNTILAGITIFGAIIPIILIFYLGKSLLSSDKGVFRQ